MGNDPKIKVYIVLGPGLLAHKIDNTTEYSGLLYDIWKLMKHDLEEKYDFEEVFEDYSNYSEMVQNVHEGKYDIVIGPFQYTEKRMEIVGFTSPIIMSKDSILTFPKQSLFQYSLDIIKNVFVGPFTMLFIIGFIFGYILYKVEPKRFQYLKKHGSGFYLPLRRAIVTTTSTLLGEAGYMSENSTLSVPGIIVMFMIMIIAFFFLSYIQALTTERVIYLQNVGTITRDNLHQHTFLASKGYVVAEKIARFGAKIEYRDESVSKIVKYYKKNKHRYDGIALDYLDAKSREEPSIRLLAHEEGFGFKEIAFVVSLKMPRLLHDMNTSIIKLQNALQMEKICKSYIDQDDAYLCVL